MTSKKEITFVLQGPVIEGVTGRSVDNIKELFPESSIILSTWKGENVEGIDVSRVVFNQDPGSTVLSYGKDNNQRTANVNRQIVSTVNGLKSVETSYAVKIRTDNVLHKDDFFKYIDLFESRNSEYSLFDKRIVSSNFYAKEFVKGLALPYFFSDFFHFGLTKDLLTLWDLPLFEDYIFNKNLRDQFQHKQYPMRCSHVEQDLFISCINKETSRLHDLFDELGEAEDVVKSYQYLINNFVVLDGDIIGLEVPARLAQKGNPPCEFYSHLRWKWLYEKCFNIKTTIPLNYKTKWYINRCYIYLKSGLRYQIKQPFLLMNKRKWESRN
ncbi:WavE lipopolysaccharide synthesis family protein [Vibrio coralliilyticus]|uniref:WavE lipopolysaccharide synthesis family protein n=1 Tax=Vibrio coralliilyticus TaxID=190893 RepID=UPI000C1642F8|nr:WavE lipopolysaccharide synthesis family protein [Vibrio coralliilyticus]